MEFPVVATGSIVCLTVPDNRSSDNEPRQIPAIVLDQFADDGTLVLFCFHFGGQFLSRARAQDVEIMFNAGETTPQRAAALDELREIVRNDIATLQRQFVEFQEQVLSMIIDRPDTIDAPPIPPDIVAAIAASPAVAPELPESDPAAIGVASTSARRRR